MTTEEVDGTGRRITATGATATATTTPTASAGTRPAAAAGRQASTRRRWLVWVEILFPGGVVWNVRTSILVPRIILLLLLLFFGVKVSSIVKIGK